MDPLGTGSGSLGNFGNHWYRQMERDVGWSEPLQLEHCLVRSVPYICMFISCKLSYRLENWRWRQEVLPKCWHIFNKTAWHHHMPKYPLKIVPTSRKPQRYLTMTNQLTLTLLMWTIWRAPTNTSKWRMGFNSAFKGLIPFILRIIQNTD